MLNQFYPTTLCDRRWNYNHNAGYHTQMPVAFILSGEVISRWNLHSPPYQGRTTINGNPQLTVTTTAGRQTVKFSLWDFLAGIHEVTNMETPVATYEFDVNESEGHCGLPVSECDGK